jgi:hypothetical protein
MGIHEVFAGAKDPIDLMDGRGRASCPTLDKSGSIRFKSIAASGWICE